MLTPKSFDLAFPSQRRRQPYIVMRCMIYTRPINDDTEDRMMWLLGLSERSLIIMTGT
jgi:hypothetical protein